jgi:hypothetical protein
VFISHVEEDAADAAAVGRGLQAAGYSTWSYRESHQSGGSYLVDIAHAIDAATAVVVIISHETCSSLHVNNEITASLESRKLFFPLLKGLTIEELRSHRSDWTLAFGPALATRLSDRELSTTIALLVQGLARCGVLPDRIADPAPFLSPFPPQSPEPIPVASALSIYVGWGAFAIVLGLLCCSVAGFVATQAYNNALGLGEFASDSAADYLGIGAKVLAGPGVGVIIGIVLFNVVRLLALFTSATSPSMAKAQSGASRIVRAWAGRLALNNVDQATRALTIVGVAALGGVCWTYSALIVAFTSKVDRAPVESLAALGSGNRQAYLTYRMTLLCLLVALVAVLVALLRRRLSETHFVSFAPLAGILGVITLVVLLIVAPWRIYWRSEFQRATFDGKACLVIGRQPDRLLLHCPAAPPGQRNVPVSPHDAKLSEQGARGRLYDDYGPPSPR